MGGVLFIVLCPLCALGDVGVRKASACHNRPRLEALGLSLQSLLGFLLAGGRGLILTKGSTIVGMARRS